jgi:hypothetical protein
LKLEGNGAKSEKLKAKSFWTIRNSLKTMFCPKCGIENPDTGKFCRSCGTDLGNVSDALSGKLVIDQSCGTTRRGRPLTLEGVATKFFMGVAFLVISIALAVTGRGGGWWFWMLVPAFMFIGSGMAQFFQLRRAEQGRMGFSAESARAFPTSARSASLPPQSTNFAAAVESRYKTGDLVPPSVTDNTTRHLDMPAEVNPDGETMALPKR